jgi:hypothetical protein
MSVLQPTRIAALLLAALASVFGIGGWRLGLWADGSPGAGLLPFCVAMLMAPMIALLLREGGAADEPFERTPFLAIGLSCAYALLLPKAGFALATVVLVTLWVRFLHGQGLVRAVLLAVGLTAAGVGLFGGLLKVPMPLLPTWP